MNVAPQYMFCRAILSIIYSTLSALHKCSVYKQWNGLCNDDKKDSKLKFYWYMLYESLWPWHSTSSGCRWRRWLPDMRIAMNTLNKESQATSCCPPTWGLGKGLTTPHHKKTACYKMCHMPLDLNNERLGSIKCGEFLDWTSGC